MDADFNKLYLKYKDSIFSYVLYLCGDWNIAENICQDVFLKIYLNLNKFEQKSSFKTWIYKISLNTYLNYAKRNSVCSEQLEVVEEKLLDKNMGPEEYVLYSESKTRIFETLKKMSEKYRNLIILRDIQNMSYREIALINGQELNAVKVGIYRARKQFQKIYNELEGKQ